MPERRCSSVRQLLGADAQRSPSRIPRRPWQRIALAGVRKVFVHSSRLGWSVERLSRFGLDNPLFVSNLARRLKRCGNGSPVRERRGM